MFRLFRETFAFDNKKLLGALSRRVLLHSPLGVHPRSTETSNQSYPICFCVRPRSNPSPISFRLFLQKTSLFFFFFIQALTWQSGRMINSLLHHATTAFIQSRECGQLLAESKKTNETKSEFKIVLSMLAKTSREWVTLECSTDRTKSEKINRTAFSLERGEKNRAFGMDSVIIARFLLVTPLLHYSHIFAPHCQT